MKVTHSYRAKLTFFCLAGIVAATGVGHATTTTGSLSVSATVGVGGGSCSVSNSSLSFGTLTFSVPVEANGNISLNCTSGTPYAVDLGVGLHSGPSSARQLATAAGGPGIPYNLFRDPDYSMVWGTGSGGTQVSGTGNGGTQAIPVFGRIPSADPPLPAGSYTDTVTITVTF